MKVVINACFGGFSLSPEATLKLYAMGCKSMDATHVDKYWPPEKREEEDAKYPRLGYKTALTEWREYLAGVDKGRGLFLLVFSPDEQYVLNGGRDIPREDPMLIQVVEEMGEKANGACAKLEIIEIPDDVDWEISEYDGNEHLAEKHRTWPRPPTYWG